MAYFAPYIDETGFRLPEYKDVRDELVIQYKSIFGDDVYLENDSQDYQLISIFAGKLYDVMLLAQEVYHARSPMTSIGDALDGVVAINGIKRKTATYSKVVLRITGTPGTVIAGGSASDHKNAHFAFSGPVEIQPEGVADVEAVCSVLGRTTAAPGTIVNIDTPTRGWLAVTNPEAAVEGQETEIDAQLRARQAISTANPSKTVLQGTVGAVAAVAGVTRYRVYENDTSLTDENGIPSHSISVVAEGGEDDALVRAVYLHKTPGTGTYGDQAVTVPESVTGEQPIDIRFFRPEYVDITVRVTVKKLSGYTTAVEDEIKESVADYINALRIGDDLPVSWLWAAALCKGTHDGGMPAFSIVDLRAAGNGGALGTEDIVVAFNQVARSYPEYVEVNEV